MIGREDSPPRPALTPPTPQKNQRSSISDSQIRIKSFFGGLGNQSQQPLLSQVDSITSTESGKDSRRSICNTGDSKRQKAVFVSRSFPPPTTNPPASPLAASSQR